jgi:hypothetical protein
MSKDVVYAQAVAMLRRHGWLVQPRRNVRINVTLSVAVGAILLYAPTTAVAAKPDFGPNVAVFDPSMPAAEIQERINR